MNRDEDGRDKEEESRKSVVGHPMKGVIKRMEASVRLGHKRLRTLMKRSSLWYLPGGCLSLFLVSSFKVNAMTRNV